MDFYFSDSEEELYQAIVEGDLERVYEKMDQFSQERKAEQRLEELEAHEIIVKLTEGH